VELELSLAQFVEKTLCLKILMITQADVREDVRSAPKFPKIIIEEFEGMIELLVTEKDKTAQTI